MVTAFVSLLAGGSLGPEAPLADKLKLNEQETRSLGFGGVSGMLAAFITSSFRRPILGLELAQGGTGGKQTYFWVLFPSLLASAVATVVFVLLSGTFFETLYKFPAYTPHLLDLLYGVPLGLVGGAVGLLFMLTNGQSQPRYGARTKRPTSHDPLDEYGLRFDIEENFLDDKSAGFQPEESVLRNADTLARLCLVLAVVTLYLTSTGTAIVTLNRRRLVDVHWQRGLSYLQIGWRYVLRALADAERLLTDFWLEPGSDPEPVYASKKQAQTAMVTFSSLYFDD